MSTATEAIDIDIVFAAPDASWTRSLRVAPGSTVAQALLQAGLPGALTAHWPDGEPAPAELQDLKVGIYGQRCELEQVLASRDRIEIYRELAFDPMESRRRRHAHKQAASGRAARPRRLGPSAA